MQKRSYQSGFGNHFESEAIDGVLIPGRNSPQQVPHGLYAEQINGSAFTVARVNNLRSWLYRIRPSVTHGEFKPYTHPLFLGEIENLAVTPPSQMRWNPIPLSDQQHFINSLFPMASNGSINLQTGASIYLYNATLSMTSSYFYNADGEMLIVLQQGALRFHTEFGILDVEPSEIIVIPRGIKFSVELRCEHARGYICENFGSPFRLPDLGIIGANGLANPRDFLSPHAYYEDKPGEFELIVKYQGRLWSSALTHSPLDVVAWHGNYLPYKYNLALFNTINTVSFDHPDPSIFTVLSSLSQVPGVANVDFVIFPPRWMVANDTFRPPYFHRNIMSEFMGLIHGHYDAKATGFLPGGSSLHNCMSAHGPDLDAYQKGISAELQPHYYSNNLAFMFESRQPWQLTKVALNASFRQTNYHACWAGLESQFKLNALPS
jgi:homogentisate 1,2-dioxygenase